ncbi:helix-turn-helix domain-containing protein [Galbibacter sp.]|uniref:helix-turn-helix domain-containing protein n=1 Tax=Galbibacter sp. TaxID=2918471 RepID=UPI003A907A6B
MNIKRQQIIATIVKEKRVELKYTQQELADISNISLRSIQRIEKGVVNPRMHTLKTLSIYLNFSMDILDNNYENSTVSKELSFYKEAILSVIILCTILLIATAYIAQSSSFPETNFELCIYYLIIITLTGLMLFKLWKNKTLTTLIKNSKSNSQ